MRPSRGRMVLLALTCTQLGCSFVFVKGPPSSAGRRRDPFEPVADCTETRLPPILDTVAASIGGAYALGALATMTGTPPADSTAEERERSATLRGEIFWSGLAVGAVMTASAIWGFRATRKCRDYVEERSKKDSLWLRPAPP